MPGDLPVCESEASMAKLSTEMLISLWDSRNFSGAGEDKKSEPSEADMSPERTPLKVRGRSDMKDWNSDRLSELAFEYRFSVSLSNRKFPFK